MTIDSEDHTGHDDRSSAKHATKLIKDIRDVGNTKPLGYLPVETIIKCGETLVGVINEAQSRGNVAIHLVGEEIPGSEEGSLFVYNIVALKALLDSHTAILEAAGWPTEVSSFVEKAAKEVAPPNSPLFDLIADAYGDSSNPLRSKIKNH